MINSRIEPFQGIDLRTLQSLILIDLTQVDSIDIDITVNPQGTAALSIARGSGQCLNFTATFVIILMFRHLLTWLRSTSLHFLFPLDESIKFHKLVGWTTLFLSMIHTIAHIVNFSK